MSALVTATDTRSPSALGDREPEILARIDRGGLSICEAELRHTLRWDGDQGQLLDVLADLESRGLIESALHFRLTDHGRARLPDDYEPPLRAGTGTGIPWKVSRSGAGQPPPLRPRART
jgi:hypothetical protein